MSEGVMSSGLLFVAYICKTEEEYVCRKLVNEKEQDVYVCAWRKYA